MVKYNLLNIDNNLHNYIFYHCYVIIYFNLNYENLLILIITMLGYKFNKLSIT